MTATISRRAVLLLGAFSPCLALQSAQQAAAADETVRLTVTIDKDIEADFGPAELIVDGEKQGLLSAGCCMYISITPGQHELILRWPDADVSKVFIAETGKEVSFVLSADRQLTLSEP